MESLQQINDSIVDSFTENEPFSLVRVGNTEGYFIQCIHNEVIPQGEFFNWLFTTAGVWPVDMGFLVNSWYPVNTAAMRNADHLGFVDISEEVKKDKSFLSGFNTNAFFKEMIEVLDPGTLLDNKKIQEPWTKSLRDKKVLVVSSHKNTIESQWDNIDLIWGNHRKDIVPFDLVGVVRSPFTPILDDRQYDNCHSWLDSLHCMFKEIDTYDYDVLLIGAGAYSPALANHAKSNGKIGITVCGAIQLFFGIYGTRWLDRNTYPFLCSLYNEYWKYPMEIDLPAKKHGFESFEKAYW